MWLFTHLMWFKARNVDLWGCKGKKTQQGSVTFGLKLRILSLKEIKQWTALHYLSFKERADCHLILAGVAFEPAAVSQSVRTWKRAARRILCAFQISFSHTGRRNPGRETGRNRHHCLAHILKCNPRKWHLVIKHLFLWW